MIRRSVVALTLAAAAFAAQIPAGQAAQPAATASASTVVAAHPAPAAYWCWDPYWGGWYPCYYWQ